MIRSPSPFLSVIIVTKNRAEALRTISLPSLVRQDSRGFEVIVWDASENDASRRLAGGFATEHPDLMVRYYSAPRAGSCAQRNDAVKEARSEIVFFIDDDCEVSPDGIAALRDMFAHQATLAGGCLPLECNWPVKRGQCMWEAGKVSALLSNTYRSVFYTSPQLSGMYPASLPAKPGSIDRLWGGDMAIRKQVFQMYQFDERLQKYSGYALWEDQLFSHRLHREGLLLLIAPKGLVTHRAASSDRGGNPFNKGRIVGYNAGIVWITSIFPYAPWSVVHFVWARFGFFLVALLACLLWPWQRARWQKMAGYVMGLSAFMVEQMRDMTRGSTEAVPS